MKRPQITVFFPPVFVLLVAAALVAALPAAGQLQKPKKASLEVAADRTAYEPGSTVRAAGIVTIDDGWHVNSHTPSYDYLIPTVLTWTLPAGFAEPKVEYPAHKMQKFAFTDEPIAVYDGKVRILTEIVLPAGTAAGTLELPASLRYQACDHESCLPPTKANTTLEIVVGSGGEPANEAVFAAAFDGGDTGSGGDTGAGHGDPSAAVPAAPSTALGGGLLGILALAVVGGLLLNAMPCVLPVLSLKVFGLVESASKGRSHIVKGCLATTAGVLVSFWALAGAAVGAKVAGEAVGWGMQFQHPGFVAFLAVVVVLFSLNMWGLFEIILPQKLMMMGGSGSGEGFAGHFASGLFATLMATPCSAPFLGTAVGFALAQTPVFIFLIFTAIGLGLALPYLVLAVVPAAGKWLPKPGAWMVTFRGVMGFLLAAAAVWLFYVLAAQVTAESLAYIQIAILGLALCTWLMSRAENAPGRRRFASVGVAAMAVLTIVLAINSPAPSATAAAGSNYYEWLAFDESQAKNLSGEGRLVFIDFTADWCFTCKTNERLVIETSEIADAFSKHGVVTMKADWTNPDEAIASFLARYGKSAVPFYLLYRPGKDPHVFSEILTKKQILDALTESTG